MQEFSRKHCACAPRTTQPSVCTLGRIPPPLMLRRFVSGALAFGRRALPKSRGTPFRVHFAPFFCFKPRKINLFCTGTPLCPNNRCQSVYLRTKILNAQVSQYNTVQCVSLFDTQEHAAMIIRWKELTNRTKVPQCSSVRVVISTAVAFSVVLSYRLICERLIDF